MLKINQKGYAGGLIVGLLAVAILGVLYFSLSVRRVAVGTQELNDQGLIDPDAKNIYAEALKKAKEVVFLPVRNIDETDYFAGAMDAPAQLIVYMDFSCEFCAEYADSLLQARQEFGGQLALVLRYFSLEPSENVLWVMEAAECAGIQGKYWEMFAKFYADNKSGNLFVEKYQEDAAALGLDKDKFSQCLADKKFENKILQQMAEAKTFGVIGAPTSFLNGKIIPGAVPFDNYTDNDGNNMLGLKNMIEEEIAVK
jgi:protein-disulfide isomerase